MNATSDMMICTCSAMRGTRLRGSIVVARSSRRASALGLTYPARFRPDQRLERAGAIVRILGDAGLQLPPDRLVRAVPAVRGRREPERHDVGEGLQVQGVVEPLAGGEQWKAVARAGQLRAQLKLQVLDAR